jgi:hypothetical protein
MALRSHCSPNASNSAPTTRRSVPIGIEPSAGPSAATRTASTIVAAPTPIRVERQPRTTPTPSTIVYASTISTALARKAPVTIRTVVVFTTTGSPRSSLPASELSLIACAIRAGGRLFLRSDSPGVRPDEPRHLTSTRPRRNDHHRRRDSGPTGTASPRTQSDADSTQTLRGWADVFVGTQATMSVTCLAAHHSPSSPRRRSRSLPLRAAAATRRTHCRRRRTAPYIGVNHSRIANGRIVEMGDAR